MNKKVLILTMTCGEGHNSVSRAVSSYLTENNYSTEIYDIYSSSKQQHDFNNKGYLFACKYIPKTYNFVWNKLKHRNPEKRYKGGVQNSIKKVLQPIENKIKEYEPNLIICSHYYASAIVTRLKRENRIADIKTFAILTDFLPHPYWEASIGLDKILIPNKVATNQLIEKGFNNSQIHVSGFPIATKFYDKLNADEIRNKMNLENKFTVLVLGGGFGTGKSEKIVKELDGNCTNLQIICVAGRNEKTKIEVDKIAKNSTKNTIISLGFVSNMNELMEISDIAITRAGCATICECIAKNLPMIIRENPIINEKENADVLVNAKIAKVLKNKKQVAEIINYIANNKNVLAEMKENIEKFKNNNSLENILKLVNLTV